jgi:hypothetical protein
MSAGIASLIAHAGFWFLLVYGLAWDELRVRGASVFAALWLAGYFLAPSWPVLGPGFFTAFAALLDIVLVFIIFKGDVRL